MRLQLIGLASLLTACAPPSNGVKFFEDMEGELPGTGGPQGGSTGGMTSAGSTPPGSTAPTDPTNASNPTGAPTGAPTTVDPSGGTTDGLIDETDGAETGTTTGPPPPPPPVELIEWSFGTTSYAGQFAPDNIVAAWVERDDGTFLRTLVQLGVIEDIHLVMWHTRASGNQIDAITGPSPGDHGTIHAGVWDLRDATGATIGDGDYVIRFEMTESNSAAAQPDGPTFDIPFTIGNGHFDHQPAGDAFFHSLRAYGHD